MLILQWPVIRAVLVSKALIIIIIFLLLLFSLLLLRIITE